MAAVLLPAISTGASAVASQLPTVVKKVKELTPQAYAKLKQLTAQSNLTPEKVASVASNRRDPMLTQSFLGQMIQAGVPGGLIGQHIPVLSDQDLRELETMYSTFVAASRDQTDRAAVRVNAPQLMLDTMKVKQIKLLTRVLSISSEDLADVLPALRSVTVDDIRQYQAGFRAMGMNTQ